jgi:glutamyl-tRNA synthetase
MKNIVTRLAPSPTGNFCHIGNLRTLLYNYFLAKRHGGKFLIRLEDTDRDRYTPAFLDYFKDMCNWLGIVPDASYWNPDASIGTFVQSTTDYSNKINFLLDNGLAYYAFDSKDDLDKAHKSIPNFKYDSTTRLSMKNSLTMSKDDIVNAIATTPYVIRFLVTPNIDIIVNDAILGDITISSNTIDDKVLIKSNGVPSYTLANVCDDHDMGVTHVLRGNEWVPSTPCHILLYKAFGWDVPTFAHLPLIMNPDGKGKLSKRTAAKYGIPIAPLGYTDSDGTYVNGWKDLGYDPQAFINSLSLIGWNPGGDVEIMSMDELISNFSLGHVHKAGARFDMGKARWINSQYLKKMNNSDLMPFINVKDDRYSDDKLDMIISLAKDRADFKNDLQHIVDLFYDDPIITDIKSFNDDYLNVMSFSKMDSFMVKCISVNFDDPNDIKNMISSICDGLGIKMGKIMPGLRMALVGGLAGPDLMTTMSILGKNQTRIRISTSLMTFMDKKADWLRKTNTN